MKETLIALLLDQANSLSSATSAAFTQHFLIATYSLDIGVFITFIYVVLHALKKWRLSDKADNEWQGSLIVILFESNLLTLSLACILQIAHGELPLHADERAMLLVGCAFAAQYCVSEVVRKFAKLFGK